MEVLQAVTNMGINTSLIDTVSGKYAFKNNMAGYYALIRNLMHSHCCCLLGNLRPGAVVLENLTNAQSRMILKYKYNMPVNYVPDLLLEQGTGVVTIEVGTTTGDVDEMLQRKMQTQNATHFLIIGLRPPWRMAGDIPHMPEFQEALVGISAFVLNAWPILDNFCGGDHGRYNDFDNAEGEDENLPDPNQLADADTDDEEWGADTIKYQDWVPPNVLPPLEKVKIPKVKIDAPDEPEYCHTVFPINGDGLWVKDFWEIKDWTYIRTLCHGKDACDKRRPGDPNGNDIIKLKAFEEIRKDMRLKEVTSKDPGFHKYFKSSCINHPILLGKGLKPKGKIEKDMYYQSKQAQKERKARGRSWGAQLMFNNLKGISRYRRIPNLSAEKDWQDDTTMSKEAEELYDVFKSTKAGMLHRAMDICACSIVETGDIANKEPDTVLVFPLRTEACSPTEPEEAAGEPRVEKRDETDYYDDVIFRLIGFMIRGNCNWSTIKDASEIPFIRVSISSQIPEASSNYTWYLYRRTNGALIHVGLNCSQAHPERIQKYCMSQSDIVSAAVNADTIIQKLSAKAGRRVGLREALIERVESRQMLRSIMAWLVCQKIFQDRDAEDLQVLCTQRMFASLAIINGRQVFARNNQEWADKVEPSVKGMLGSLIWNLMVDLGKQAGICESDYMRPPWSIDHIRGYDGVSGVNFDV